jgi:hypothetical protein
VGWRIATRSLSLAGEEQIDGTGTAQSRGATPGQ